MYWIGCGWYGEITDDEAFQMIRNSSLPVPEDLSRLK